MIQAHPQTVATKQEITFRQMEFVKFPKIKLKSSNPIIQSMASLNGVDLTDSNTRSGGAFLLKEKPDSSEVFEIGNEWEIEMSKNSPYLIARSGNELNSEEVLEHSLEAVQQSLDILSVREHTNRRIEKPRGEHIIWWKESGEDHLRAYNTAELPLSIDAHVTLHRDGEEVVPERDPITWHESFRYYRLAQLTDDIISAYRNLFLALEMILSSEVNGYYSPEGRWLVDSLEEVQENSKINLENVIMSDSYDGSPATALKQEQWTTVRNEVFHAKQQKNTIRPRSNNQREKVHQAMVQLSRLYISLVGEYLGVNIPTGGFTHKGFELMVGPVTENGNFKILPRDLEESKNCDDMTVGDSFSSAAIHSDKLSEGGKEVLLGKWDCNKSDIQQVRSFCLFDDDNKGIAKGYLASDLSLEDIDNFHLALALQLKNVGTPRRLYPS